MEIPGRIPRLSNPQPGDIIIAPFPFTDLTDSKIRPALVLADLKGNDVILCQITSQCRHTEYAV